LLVFSLIIVSSSGGSASEQTTPPEPARYRVFSLHYITAAQGRQYLAEAELGTVSQLPGTDTLLVTAGPNDLAKAAGLLKLVDSEQKYAVKKIFTASEAEFWRAGIDGLVNRLADVSVGSFLDPPSAPGDRAIIDVHGSNVLAVAPEPVMQKIVAIVGQLHQARAEAKAMEMKEFYESAEPNGRANLAADVSQRTEDQPPETGKAVEQPEPNERPLNEDVLFSRLLGSLDEAEQKAAEQPVLSEVEGPTAPKVEPAGQQPAMPQGEPRVEPQMLPAPEIELPEPKVEQPEPNEPAIDGKVVLETEEPNDINKQATGMPRRSYEPQPLADGKETIELELPDKLNIIDLLDLVGKHLDLDYVYEEKDLAGKEVSLRVQGPIEVRELYPLLESILKFHSLVMSRKGNLVTVRPMASVLEIDPALIDTETGQVRFGDVVVTRVFELSYVDTATAKTLLDGLKLSADVTQIPETGTLIVTGYAFRMERIERLLEMIDKPGEPREFRFRQLRYTMAQTLAPKIKSLVEQLGEISITVARGQGQQPQQRQAARRPPARRPTPTPAPEQASAASKPSVYLDADERTNRILMIGRVGELDVVEELISALDVEQQDLRTLRLYEIQHVDAEEVRTKLQELGIVGGTSRTDRRGGRITQARPGQPQAQARPAQPQAPAAPMTPGGAGAEPLAEEPQVVIIESTNSLLVNASAEQHIQIATIIGYIDAETLAQTIPYEIYGLENQSPTDLADVLNKLIQETIMDKEGKVEQVIRREEEIVIVPDENTFSLIVYASKKNQEWVRKLIKGLDRRRPQVLIDVALVEITREDLFQYDLSLIANAGGLVTGNIGVSSTTFPITSSIGNELEGGWNITDSEGTVTGQTRGFYGEDRIQALLTAIDKKDYGRVLAQPKILVNDNEEGAIKTTDTTYVTRTSSIPVTSGTAGQQTTLIQTQTEFEGYDAGITLNITPHISEGNLLRLDIGLVRSDFGTITGTKPPDTTTSDITTVVTVPDGSTIILGGLTKLKQTKAGSKVPLLGDIPLVGGLFRNVANSDKANKLYIFVKANILRPDETAAGLGQLQQISAMNRVAFEREEKQFQAREDWPGLEPAPMEPVRVLEPQQ